MKNKTKKQIKKKKSFRLTRIKRKNPIKKRKNYKIISSETPLDIEFLAQNIGKGSKLSSYTPTINEI